MGDGVDAPPAGVRSPEELVERVLEACNRSAEDGARELWRHSAPRFRRGLEGERHLAELLSNDLYRPLCEWSSYLLEESQRVDNSARLLAVVTTAPGERAAYLFAMSVPAGSDACHWLVSGIERQ